MPLKPLRAVAAIAAVLLCSNLAPAQDQAPAPPPPDQLLSPDQLDDLVAPIALYPDELVGQLLVAATYPLEVVEAFQWMQKNPGLAGPALTQAAQQQNWDPSVQALVVFPDVLKRLHDDVAWTTALGNAFLAQQQDVMDGIQRMRQRARESGKLQSTPQQNVVMADQGGAPVVEIEPVNPEVIYVPVYDPVSIWGPAVWYPYPRWWGPAGGYYFGFGPAIHIGFFFGGGWGGWGGWGWHPGWVNRTVIVNNTFIRRYNFNSTHIANPHGTTVWTHDPAHRMAVPYPRQAATERARGDFRQNVVPRQSYQPAREAPRPQPAERTWNRDNSRPAQPPERGAFGGSDFRRSAQPPVDRGSMAPQRSMPAPRVAPPPRPAPAPRAAPAPRSAPSGRDRGARR